MRNKTNTDKKNCNANSLFTVLKNEYIKPYVNIKKTTNGAVVFNLQCL